MVFIVVGSRRRVFTSSGVDYAETHKPSSPSADEPTDLPSIEATFIPDCIRVCTKSRGSAKDSEITPFNCVITETRHRNERVTASV